MTSAELKRWLRKQGCTFESSKSGTGHLTVRLGSRKTSLPMHGSGKELGTGLVKKIKKDLGLQQEAHMLAYPIDLTPDDNDTLLVTCPDLPEVTTFGEDEADALLRAVDAIEEMLAARMADKQDIPPPSLAMGRPEAVLPTQTALKVALYQAMRESGLRKADLARRLSAHAPQVDRLLDLRHASRLDQMEAAFKAVGKRLDVRVEPR